MEGAHREMSKEWIIAPEPPDRAAAAARWGVPPLVAHLLLSRGLTPDCRAHEFLSPPLTGLIPPGCLPGARVAADRIVNAARSGKRIVIYGDYDVDGITAAAILWHVLRAIRASVSYYIPHRIEEGYGLNLEAVKRLAADGAELIVSVDCGVTAYEVADWARGAGLPLVITDHHAFHGPPPVAEAVVHPGLDASFPNQDLCGAGVAFKLAWLMAQQYCGAERVSPEFRQLLLALLPMAALGTIADVVPLVGENRVIARHGLAGLRETRWPGLRALIDSAGLRGRRIDDYDVGFKLAPRLNAAGRMGHAGLAAELLTTADAARGAEIAAYLEDHNRSRQSTERKILNDACAQIDRNGLAGDARRAIVLGSEGWHPGVIGIVASRLVERYHRPTILIALANGEGQGSGRSIRSFHLHEALHACSEHLLSFGGHAMAAGLRIATGKVADFAETLVAVANNRLTGADLRPKLRLDGQVDLHELTMPTAEALQQLAPFGMGNPRPRFASDYLDLAGEPRCVGTDGTHLQARFAQGGVQMAAIGYGMASRIEELKHRRRCRVAFEPIINEFNGRRTVEMQLIDFAF